MTFTRRDVAAMAAAVLAPGESAWADSSASPTWDRIRRTGRLRLGVVPAAPPYSVKDVATGEYRGFCVDLGRDLARHLEVAPVWVETRWGNAPLDLQADKIDAHVGLAPTPTRRRAIAFSDTLFDNVYCAVARTGLSAERWSDLDRPDLTIAVDLGSSHDQIATRVFTRARVVRFDSLPEAALAVQTARADAQILAVLIARVMLARRPGLGRLLLPTPLQTTPTCIGLRHGVDLRFQQAVNAWIAQARAAGRVQAAVMTHLRAQTGSATPDLPSAIRF